MTMKKLLTVVGALILAALGLFVILQTEKALCLLLGISHSYGAVYLILTLGFTLLLIHELKEPSWGHPWLNVAIGFVSCWFLYYGMLCALWSVACLLPCISGPVHAWGTVAAAAAALLLVLLGHLNTKPIRTVRYEISLGSGGKDCRIGLVSDIHLGAYVGQRHVQRLVRALNRGNFDLVVIAGDLFDEDKSLLKNETALRAISRAFGEIRTAYGVFLALGNHDPKADDPAFIRFLADSGITLLHNRAVTLPPLTLVGRTNGAKNPRTPVPAVTRDRPLAVIDHDPRDIPESVQQGADLVLCGHTHAGQLFPFNILTRLAVGKRYFYGHHRFGRTHAVISSGAGIFNLPVRIGSSNEIAEVRIRQ